MPALKDQTPVEIDSKLAELYQREGNARLEQIRIERSLREAAERTAAGYAPRSRFTEQDALAVYRSLEDIIEEQLPLEAEYERRSWQRYWHVTNNNGHVHTTTGCSSCFPTTEFAWRIDLSGLAPEQVVVREAHNACSVCMPIAPVEQRAARERFNREQREAKAAERQTKKDAKAEKAAARAVKHVDKVEEAIEKLGGREVFENEYSLYGHDGRKSIYEWSFDNCATQVSNTLYALKDTQKRPYRDLNEHVKAELTKRGLI